MSLKKTLTGTAALAATAIILIGIPAGLILIAGNPFAGLLNLGDALSVPDYGGRYLTGTILPCIAWILWASFALSFILEAGALIRRAPAVRLPGFGLQQQTAAALIGAILLMFAAVSTASPAMAAQKPPAAAPTTITAALHAETTTPVQHEAPAAVRHAQVTVKAGDTLWSLAETHLGDGLRYTEISDLSRSITQPDGMSLGYDGVIRPGWILNLPETQAPAAAGNHVVQEGETLAALAQAKLGNADRYMEIFNASTDIEQPGGAKLTDPDLLLPGWTLAIPAAAAATAPAPVAVTPATPAPAAETIAPAITEPPAPATPVKETPAPAAAQAPAAPPAETPPAPARFTTSPAPEAATAAVPEAADETESGEDLSLLATTGGILGILAAGILATLGLKRFRQSRSRKPGQAIPVPGSDEFVTEQELVAVEATDLRSAVDQALRWLASWAAQTERRLPSLFAARLANDSIELYLNTAQELPAPFISIATDNTAWKIAAAEVPDLLTPHSAPYPALVTLGRDNNGGLLLADLESIAAMTVTGDEELTRGAMMAMAIELAVSPWADDLQVTMVGCDRQLPDVMDTGRIRHLEDLDELVADLQGRARQLDELLKTVGAEDLSHARSLGTYSENWIPEIVVLAEEPSPEVREQLAELVKQVPRVGIAAVSGSHISGPWELKLHSREAATLAPDGIQLMPQVISDEEYARIVAAMRTADKAPAAKAEQVEEVTVPDDASALVNQLAEVPSEPEPDPLAAFNNEAPFITLLGPVRLHNAAGERSTGGSHHSRSVEIIAYLALHPGVDFRTFHAAMWPGTSPEEKFQTRNSACSRARRLIGKADPDTEWFPKVVPGVDVYNLHEDVKTDWHHWKALVPGAPAAVSTENLAKALALVKAEPFNDPGRGYGWSHLLKMKMSATIADAATVLWERAFNASDFDTAAKAAAAGIKAEPYNEELHRKALRVAAATGDTKKASALVNQLTTLLSSADEDAEPDRETKDLITALRLA
ncbi:LysM peptidoglycan-binding domain-containing protein [Paenarthrobacter nicotinovorans]|uniref:LysM peptidoglycan-binding domain-containing protein n=1 Tax=Paenarthrobacter nicotinovorans TaxID=29320 RepID=UPI0011A751C4|nr:LysM peptidoglycan-binding domain-containing protein [Paenarthrobacter nicotinovorans]